MSHSQALRPSNMMSGMQKPTITSPPQHDYPPERAWTTSDCMLLLQPLINELAALRSYVEAHGEDKTQGIEPTANLECTKSEETKSVESPRDLSSNCAAQSSPLLWGEDPKSSQRIKKTYSKRNRHTARACEASQQSTSTQRVRQKFLSYKDAPPLKGSAYCLVTTDRSRVKALDASRDIMARHLKNNVKEHSALINEICVSLVSFLQMADNKEQLEHRGARTLFAMCLETVPLYIAEQERWCKAADSGSVQDVIPAAYNDLENFSSRKYGNCHPLKEVVRFHAIYLIAEAIAEGIIEPIIAREFVLCCVRYNALDEANVLLEHLISALELRTKAKPSLDLNMRGPGGPRARRGRVFSTKTLQQILQDTKESRHLFSWLLRLIEFDVQTLEWMSSLSMHQRLKHTVNSIDQHDERASHHILLICAAISRFFVLGRRYIGGELHKIRVKGHASTLQKPDRDAKISKVNNFAEQSKIPKHSESMSIPAGLEATPLKLVLVSLTTLTASCVSRKMKLQVPKEHPCILNCPLFEIVIEIHQVLELYSVLEEQHRSSELPNSIAILPLIAGLIAGTCDDTTSERVLDLHHQSLRALGKFHLTEMVFDAAVAFFCETAKQTAQILGSREEFYFLQKFIDGIINISSLFAGQHDGLKTCHDILLAAAFAFCSTDSDKEQLEWAFEIEHKTRELTDKVKNRPTDTSSARKASQSSNRYQWDDGVSEWIARTPKACVQPLTRNQAMQVEPDLVGGNTAEELLPPATPLSPNVTRTRAKAADEGRMQPRNQTQSTETQHRVVQEDRCHASVGDGYLNFRGPTADSDLPGEVWTSEGSDEDELALPETCPRPLRVLQSRSRRPGSDLVPASLATARRLEDEKSAPSQSSKRFKVQTRASATAAAAATTVTADPIFALPIEGQMPDWEDELSLGG